MQRNSRLEALHFLGKRIREAAQASAVHSQRVILFFYVARGDQFNIGHPLHNRLFDFHNFGRGIAALLRKLSMAKSFDN